jgi:hypothetical protein
MAQAQAELQRQQAQADAYATAIAEQIELEEQLAKAKEQVAAAEENKRGWGWFGESKQSHKDLETANAEFERLQAALAETDSVIFETEAAWEEAARATEEAARAPVSYEDAVSSAAQTVSEDLQALIDKYDEAYEASRNSLDGTFELFEKVEEKAGVSSQAIIDAWQAQIDFFKEYDSNLQALMNMDLDPKFLEKLSDGSQESAGQVKALMEEIGNLSADEAAARIAEINETFGELSQAKDSAAATMAEIQTDFGNKLGEIERRMTTAVGDMNMEDDAAVAAKDTINAYIREIEAGVSRAQTAAASVANAAASQLASNGISTAGIPGYATGATNAPDMFIAGENGPELIVGAGGSTVFPAEETNDILTAARHVPVETAAPGGFELGDNASYRSQEERKITLDINGSGEIDVSGADEETVWDIVAPRLKDAFMGIIRAEVFEEGDRSYAF